MSSEVFIISARQGMDVGATIRQALEDAGVKASRVQDVIFGGRAAMTSAWSARHAGLECPSVSVPSGLRAIFFAGQSILSGDVELNVVAGAEGATCAAIVLAGSEAVGRWNLMPRARLAARSLAGEDAATHAAGIAADQITVSTEGDSVVLVAETIDALEKRKAEWALVHAATLALLIQRV